MNNDDEHKLLSRGSFLYNRGFDSLWLGFQRKSVNLPASRLLASRLPASRLPASRLPASRLPASHLPKNIENVSSG